MKLIPCIAMCLVFCGKGLHAATTSRKSASGAMWDRPGWTLQHLEQFVCADEARTPVDSERWEHMIGNGESEGIPGWGNQEPQYYTASTENSAIVRDPEASNGCALAITAMRGPSPHAFTSARLRARPTSPLGSVQPVARRGLPSVGVRVAARISLPPGASAGIWPAFWMLPNERVYGGWAAGGELDIMEAARQMSQTHGTIHFGGEWPGNQHVTAQAALDKKSGYCIYAMEWWHEKIRFLRDDIVINEISSDQWYTTAVDKAANPAAPFDQAFHVLMNFAVAGTFSGQLAEDAMLPQQLHVDWISLHQELA